MAKANQDEISESNFFSLDKSTGTCSNEHDGAIHKLSPNFLAIGSTQSKIAFKSLFQIFLPFTTPSEITLPLILDITASTSTPPLTASMCKPAIGNFEIVSKLSCKDPKYVASKIFSFGLFNLAYDISKAFFNSTLNSVTKIGSSI